MARAERSCNFVSALGAAFVSGKRLDPKGASARRHGPRQRLKVQWRRAEADRREAISRAAGVRGRASAPTIQASALNTCASAPTKRERL